MGINMTGPPCPECNALITQVVVTKQNRSKGETIRRRRCEFCGHRFYTLQPNEQIVTNVVWRGRVPVVEAA